jgi:hypothetical protein
MLHPLGQRVADDADVVALLEFKLLRLSDRRQSQHGEQSQKAAIHC